MKTVFRIIIALWVLAGIVLDAYLYWYHWQHNNNLMFEPVSGWMETWMFFVLFLPMCFGALVGFALFLIACFAAVALMIYITGSFFALIGYIFTGEFILGGAFDPFEMHERKRLNP